MTLFNHFLFWHKVFNARRITRERIIPTLTNEERSTLRLLRLKYGEGTIPFHPQEHIHPEFTKSDLALLRLFRPDKNYGDTDEDS